MLWFFFSVRTVLIEATSGCSLLLPFFLVLSFSLPFRFAYNNFENKFIIVNLHRNIWPLLKWNQVMIIWLWSCEYRDTRRHICSSCCCCCCCCCCYVFGLTLFSWVYNETVGVNAWISCNHFEIHRRCSMAARRYEVCFRVVKTRLKIAFKTTKSNSCLQATVLFCFFIKTNWVFAQTTATSAKWLSSISWLANEEYEKYATRVPVAVSYEFYEYCIFQCLYNIYQWVLPQYVPVTWSQRVTHLFSFDERH